MRNEMSGASLVSAVGSLMQHLAPFLAMAMIAGGWTSVIGAGWVRSLSQIGELSVALALPLLGIADFGHRTVCAIAAVLLLAMALAAMSQQPLFMLGWFAIGACSGALKYLGTMAAARASKVRFAFAMRLAFVLILAGAAAAVLASRITGLTYQSMLLVLAIIVAAVLLLGTLMLRPGSPQPAAAGETAAKPAQTKSAFAALSGLATIYLFFVGISGVMVFVLHQAAEHQMTVATAAWAIAATKFSVGIWLVAAASYAMLKGKADRFLLQGALLVAALVGIAMSRNGLALLCALFFFEISVNSLSVRIQAAVVRGAPAYVSRYLNFVMLAGIATGPLLNGVLVSSGQAYIYVLLGAVVAFAPAAWNWLVGAGEGGRPLGTRRGRDLEVAPRPLSGVAGPAA